MGSSPKRSGEVVEDHGTKATPTSSCHSEVQWMGMSTPQLKRFALGCATFLYALGWTVTMPILPFHVKSLVALDPNGMSYASAMSIYAAVKIPATILSGILAQHFGHRFTLSFSLLGLSLSVAATGLCTSFEWVVVCRGFAGIFGTNGSLFESLIRSTSSDGLNMFNDWQMLWALAYVVGGFAVGWLDNGAVASHVCGAMCFALSALVVWYIHPFLISKKYDDITKPTTDTTTTTTTATASASRSTDARTATTTPPTTITTTTTSTPTITTTTTTAAMPPTPTSPPQSKSAMVVQSIVPSLKLFLSDYLIVIFCICNIFTPKLDYALIAREKGGNASSIATIQSRNHFIVLTMQLLKIPSRLNNRFGSKAVVVVGTAMAAVPVLLMPLCGLVAFQWMSLATMMVRAIAEPGSRNLVSNRAPPDNASSWTGWLHSARGLSQVTSSFSGSFLMATNGTWLCYSYALMQLILATVYSLFHRAAVSKTTRDSTPSKKED